MMTANQPFAFEKKNNLLTDRHIGISGDRLSVLTPESDVGKIGCLQACPFSASAFSLAVSIGGLPFPANNWQWLPAAIKRTAVGPGFELETTVAVPPEERFLVFSFFIRNQTNDSLTLPVSLTYGGGAKRLNDWTFRIPEGIPDGNAEFKAFGPQAVLYRTTPDTAIGITWSLSGMESDPGKASGRLILTAGEHTEFSLSVHIGDPEHVKQDMVRAAAHYAGFVRKTYEWIDQRAKEVFDNLPSVSSSDKRIEKLYLRSLVTYVTNRWTGPGFCISPYYSTGATNGGCMCSYLWDYSGGMCVHPLVDPETHKNQLRLYLRNDLTSSYAIMPVDGRPCGPWYQINQEKIVNMVYYYVLLTGDKDFLHETVAGKTVAQWMRFHALVGDDLSTAPHLIDYGEGGRNHLELRGRQQYRGIMPDLNARRYLVMKRAAELCRLAGSECLELDERAEGIKEIIGSLWNDKEGWFDFIWEGERETRYTVQMFKFLNSGVVPEQIKDRLLAHMNEDEFLSPDGLHSLSKKDPAYDSSDIDNGGGGICTEFAAAIICQLYETGRDALAEDILKRILWWGESFPYLGDSVSAEKRMQREDTPLQCDISSVSLAQVVLFGLSGVSVSFDKTITIAPPVRRIADKLTYKGFCLAGKSFDLEIDGDRFTVTTKDREITARIGEKIVI